MEKTSPANSTPPKQDSEALCSDPSIHITATELSTSIRLAESVRGTVLSNTNAY